MPETGGKQQKATEIITKHAPANCTYSTLITSIVSKVLYLQKC